MNLLVVAYMLLDVFNLRFLALISKLDDLVLNSAKFDNITNLEIIAFLNIRFVFKTSNNQVGVLRKLVVRKCFQAVSEYV